MCYHNPDSYSELHERSERKFTPILMRRLYYARGDCEILVMPNQGFILTCRYIKFITYAVSKRAAEWRIAMTKHEEYESRTETLLKPIVEANQLEIYDVEFLKEAGSWYLRIYIDKEEGVSIDDCELVSRAIEEKLDEEDFISEAYILEVSSPGLGRQLKKDKHFAHSIGEEVEVHLFLPLNRCKDYTGILTAFDKNTITIQMQDEALQTFERAKIAQVRLTFDF